MITDRTEEDVARWIELRRKGINMTGPELEEFKNSKGAYNYSDLNRVENAVKELSDYLNLGLTTKTNWTAEDIPNNSEMNRYLNNITAVMNKLKLNAELPKTMNNLTYQSANEIEKIVEQLQTMAGSIEINWFYSAEIYAGEV